MLAVLHFDYPICSHRARLMCPRRECIRGNSCNNSSYKLPNRPMYTHYKQEISIYHTHIQQQFYSNPLSRTFFFSPTRFADLSNPHQPLLSPCSGKTNRAPRPSIRRQLQASCQPLPRSICQDSHGTSKLVQAHPSIPVSITPRKPQRITKDFFLFNFYSAIVRQTVVLVPVP